MKRMLMIIGLICLTLLLTSCLRDSWTMDDDKEELLTQQFRDYINNVDYELSSMGSDFNVTLFNEMVNLLSEENFDRYVLTVKGIDDMSYSELVFKFRMSSINDDEIFDEDTDIYLRVEFNLEDEIYSIEFELNNSKDTERLFISRYYIMLQLFIQNESWLCIEDICYIEETMDDFITMYNSSEDYYEISVMTELGTLDVTIHYSRNDDRVYLFDSNGTNMDYCSVENMTACGLDEVQIAKINYIISIINEFRVE